MAEIEIREHERAIGRITAEQQGLSYSSAGTLSDARRLQDFALILEGDWGGTIYVTCPVEAVRCDEGTLANLLTDVDDIFHSIADGRGIYFECAPIGSRIAGGDGGAIVEKGVWCHSFIYDIDMAAAIEQVILKRVDRLVLPTIAELKNKAACQDACAAFFLFRRLKKSDPDEAHNWCIKAAKLGQLEAQKNLSLRGANPTERACWLIAMAARTEDDERIDRARYDLADAFRRGKGVEQNNAAELVLLLQSCNSRYHAGAAMRVARIYQQGIGIAIDRIAALMWALLGSSSDRRQAPYWHRPVTRKEFAEAAVLIAEIREGMTEEEIALAEKLAKEYFSDDPLWALRRCPHRAVVKW